MSIERSEQKVEDKQRDEFKNPLATEAYQESKITGTAHRQEPAVLDFSTGDIYSSRTKPNEINEAERITPLAAQQRAERLASHADMFKIGSEGPYNELSEGKPTALAQAQRNARLAIKENQQ